MLKIDYFEISSVQKLSYTTHIVYFHVDSLQYRISFERNELQGWNAHSTWFLSDFRNFVVEF